MKCSVYSLKVHFNFCRKIIEMFDYKVDECTIGKRLGKKSMKVLTIMSKFLVKNFV